MCTEQQRVGESARQQVSDNALDLARVDAALVDSVFHGKLHHFVTIDSTQTPAIADAQAGAKAGQVYIADEQTAGRGRGGHTWVSEPGSGLYLTVLARPLLRADDALTISLAAGLAVQAAVQAAAGAQIDLRWPNDLVTLGPRSLKVGGILTETVMQPNGAIRFAAIGIGINLNHNEMPPGLQDVSTSLRRLTGHTVSREAVLVTILRRLAAELQKMEESPAETLIRFADHSSWVRGKRVSVAEEGGYTGVTSGLSGSGLLRVRADDGSLREVRHGGVRELM